MIQTNNLQFRVELAQTGYTRVAVWMVSMRSSFLNYWRELWARTTGSKESDQLPLLQTAKQTKNFHINQDSYDPFLEYALQTPGVIDLDTLVMDSPIVNELRAAGVKLSVPLVSQGELIGLLNLGPRLSEQDYSQDDHHLLNSLAVQATPALRVAQLAQQRQTEAQERERIEQEMRVARIIQETLLPKQLPEINGYRLSVHWQPARAVGGDFYDFILFQNGRIGIIIGDVTDKGVPAALVMASTRSVLRASAERLVSPSAVLAEANNLMVPDMPERMFVTCLYAVLNPVTGQLRYANAGYNPPYLRTGDEVKELYAVGMPLGLLPGMDYDEKETTIPPGACVLFHSDGLVEAHNKAGEMFSFPRLRQLLTDAPCSNELIDFLITHMKEFTGKDGEQEDDVTFLTLENTQAEMPLYEQPQINQFIKNLKDWETLAEFQVPSAPGSEREAIQRVSEIVSSIGLPSVLIERLKTAVGEATMNAMEHGNKYQADLPVDVIVRISPLSLSVRISDYGGDREFSSTHEIPDIDAKLSGEQSPRGWGLFIIENMVDGMVVTNKDGKHTMDLILLIEGDQDGAPDI